MEPPGNFYDPLAPLARTIDVWETDYMGPPEKGQISCAAVDLSSRSQ
jgi:trans-aconitate methyltransferase